MTFNYAVKILNIMFKLYSVVEKYPCIRVLSLISICIICLIPATFADVNENKPSVLVIIPSGYTDDLTLQKLHEVSGQFGFGIQNAEQTSNSFKNILASVSPESDVTIVILSGAGITNLLSDPSFTKQVASWYDEGKIIAANGESPAILAKSGILKNKSATIKNSPELVREFNDTGAIYSDNPTVIGNRIITGQGENAAEEFVINVIQQMIIKEIRKETGIIYLGDKNNSARYIVPTGYSLDKISAVENNTLKTEWNGDAYNLSYSLSGIQYPTDYHNWIIIADPDTNICKIYDPDTDLEIPYGMIQNIETKDIGKRRDLSSVNQLKSNPFHEPVLSGIEKGLNETNETLRRWKNILEDYNKYTNESDDLRD